MKWLRSIVFVLLAGNIQLQGHGFSAYTLVRSDEDDCWRHISTLVELHPEHEQFVTAYDRTSKKKFRAKIKSAAQRKANCYFRLGFEEDYFNNDVLCTPDQEFYKDGKWIPAFKLSVGDVLLCKDNKLKKITNMEFVKESIDIYQIYIEQYHTYFVGRHCVLTHNTSLPILVQATIEIAMAEGAAVGGAAGSFFGPVSYTFGAGIGGVLGLIYATSFGDDRDPRDKLPDMDYKQNKIDDYRTTHHFTDFDYKPKYTHHNMWTFGDHKQKPYFTADRAPGKPTDLDGFIPPKKWDGKKKKAPNNRGHGYPHEDGGVWVPTGDDGHGGPHWDVQYPRGHFPPYKNVYPGGKERAPKK